MNTNLGQLEIEFREAMKKKQETYAFDILERICRMFTHSRKLLSKGLSYNDFANYMATQLYLRFIDDTKTPIESILAYMNTSYMKYVKKFIKDEAPQVFDYKKHEDQVEAYWNYEELITNQVVITDPRIIEIDGELYIENLPKSIYKNATNFKYVRNENDLDWLYLSLLLSIYRGEETKIGLDKELADSFTLIYENTRSLIITDIKKHVKYSNYSVEDVRWMLTYGEGEVDGL